MEAKKLDAKITFPVLYLESDYDIKGRALVVPIQGTGPFTANLSKKEFKYNVFFFCSSNLTLYIDLSAKNPYSDLRVLSLSST